MMLTSRSIFVTGGRLRKPPTHPILDFTNSVLEHITHTAVYSFWLPYIQREREREIRSEKTFVVFRRKKDQQLEFELRMRDTSDI